MAETDGRIVGSNFLDTRSLIGGIGPITIDPSVQNTGIGRQLMQTIMEHAVAKKMSGIRLVQDAFHNRSLCRATVVEHLERITGYSTEIGICNRRVCKFVRTKSPRSRSRN